MKSCAVTFGLILILTGCNGRSPAEELRSECLRALREAAASSEFWVRVHAIEYIAELGYTDEARQLIADKLSGQDQVAENRIGLWRCLYRVSRQEEERQLWLKKIGNAYLDSLGPDRIHAAETLAKLGCSLKRFDTARVLADLGKGGALASYVRWGYALPLGEEAPEYGLLLSELESEDGSRRKIAGYGLGFIGSVPPDNWSSLARLTLREPRASPAYPYLLGAACSLYDPANVHKPGLADSLRQRLLLLEKAAGKEARIELCRALAVIGSEQDYPMLIRLLHTDDFRKTSRNLDVRAAAAYSLIRLEKRRSNKSKQL